MDIMDMMLSAQLNAERMDMMLSAQLNAQREEACRKAFDTWAQNMCSRGPSPAPWGLSRINSDDKSRAQRKWRREEEKNLRLARQHRQRKRMAQEKDMDDDDFWDNPYDDLWGDSLYLEEKKDSVSQELEDVAYAAEDPSLMSPSEEEIDRRQREWFPVQERMELRWYRNRRKR